MAIEFVNVKENPELTRPFDYYIDFQSPVGNPYTLVDNDPNQCCNFYKEYFNKKIESNDLSFTLFLSRMTASYREFHKLRLFHDTTQVCNHGEFIKEWILEHYNS